MSRLCGYGGLWRDCIFACAVSAFLAPAPASGQPTGATAAADELQSLVDRRIAFYNREAPEIDFVQLAGGEHWLDSAETFHWLLGTDATNLDYAHPPDVREDLLYVSIERVLFMLRGNHVSAALFGVGSGALAERDNLCIITLEPRAVARDDLTATSHLLDLPDDSLRHIPRAHRLDHRQYLRYLVDHEAFHCLDAFYNEPIPMSMKEHWAPYMLFRNENGADAFAIAMHMREHGKRTPFVENLARIRGLCLHNADPEHLTCRAMQAVAAMPPGELTSMDVKAVLALADEVRTGIVPDYSSYLGFRAAACEVMEDLGIAIRESERALCSAAEPDQAAYERLHRLCRRCYQELFRAHPGD